jgi:ATP-dependent DNA helicase RecG
MGSPIASPLLTRLVERLRDREDLELEFKAAKGGLPQDLWPTVSAFANTHGGWIVLGVTEGDDGTFAPAGIPNPTDLLQNFHNLLRNPQKINHPVCGASDTAIEEVEGKRLLVLRVPEAPRGARPVYVGNNPYTGTYIRRNSGDFHCSKPEVDRLMREASDLTADSTVLASYGMDDLDTDTLARYRRRFQTQDPASPWNGYDDRRFLRAIGGYGRNRETGDEGVTVAGLLLVGSSEAIRDWRSRHLIDYRRVPGDLDSDIRWDDRVTWEGNLFGAFETLYPRLIAGQPVPFQLKDGIRIDESAAHVALREALVNLLVHADYAETQVSLLVHSPEGYFLRNPGSSRVSEIDLLTGDRSDPRNPILVRMFRLVGLADEAGTGMPKIISAWRSLGFRLPRIDVGTERYEFALRLRHAHLLSEEDRAWLSALGESWSESEQLALVFAKHEGEIDNPTLRSLTGLHPSDVTKVLGGLRNRDLLIMTGSGRTARYQLGSGASELPVHPQSSVPDPQSSDPDSEGQEQNPQTTRDDEQTLWQELKHIMTLARRGGRISGLARDALIVQLCAHTPLSLKQLGELVGLSEPYLREVLRKLVAAGRLAFLYPHQPNHPRQRYIAREDVSPQSGNAAVVAPERADD